MHGGTNITFTLANTTVAQAKIQLFLRLNAVVAAASEEEEPFAKFV